MKELLKKSGLSDKEAEVYAAMVATGPAPVSSIAKQAHIKRSTAYVILDFLTERGLVKMASRRGGKLYYPLSPEKFIKNLESKAKEFNETASEMKKIIPKIESMSFAEGATPKVQVLKGSEGMKTVYEDALTSLETIRSYAFSKQQKETSKEAKEYYGDLAKKNIKVQILNPRTAEAHVVLGKQKSTGGPNLLPEISIYDNKVVFASTQEKFGLIIESKELAQALKQAFDLSWKDAKSGQVIGEAK